MELLSSTSFFLQFTRFSAICAVQNNLSQTWQRLSALQLSTAWHLLMQRLKFSQILLFFLIRFCCCQFVPQKISVLSCVLLTSLEFIHSHLCRRILSFSSNEEEELYFNYFSGKLKIFSHLYSPDSPIQLQFGIGGQFAQLLQKLCSHLRYVRLLQQQ